MKALAVLVLLLGVMALLQRPADFSAEEAARRIVAMNYAAYRSRVQDGFCYVYGEASPQEAEAVRQLFRESLAVGLADQGRIVPVLRHPVPVPAFVPNGSIVSVTEA